MNSDLVLAIAALIAMPDLVKDLVRALDENTAARLGGDMDAADTSTPNKGSVAGRKAAAAEKKAKEEAEKKTETPKKEEKVTHETLRAHVVNERERLGTSVSAEAVALHKTKSTEILKKFGAASISKLEDKDVAEAYKLFLAIDCSTAPESGDNDDDDL